MNSFIALLRGINVGGRNALPMKQLVAICEELKAEDVRTYIQSGNVVFRHGSATGAELSRKIGTAIKNQFGLEPQVIVMTRHELESAMRHNPFPEAEGDPASLHLGFLSEPPITPDLAKLESLRVASERFELIGRVFYLHAPEGVGRSKLAASSERLLGVPMTDRNWRTVAKLRELATS